MTVPLDRPVNPIACDPHAASHHRHFPVPLGAEWHHLVPREWQRAWHPPDVTPTIDPTYGPVWILDGVWVARTCHGNVHVGISRLTHAWEAGMTSVALAADRVRVTQQPDRDLWATSQRALTLWMEHGGSVDFLVARGLWGSL